MFADVNVHLEIRKDDLATFKKAQVWQNSRKQIDVGSRLHTQSQRGGIRDEVEKVVGWEFILSPAD